MNEKDIKRFRSKTKVSDRHEWNGSPCIDWTAGKFDTGYGNFWIDGKSVGAHRVSWELYRGKIPEGEGYHGTCVLHRCDRPCCVNPDHLFLGTNQDNVDDKVTKGREAKGTLHGAAKLAESDVLLIKQFLQRHPTQIGRYGGQCSFLGRWFGVGKEIISQISMGRKWKHITTKGVTR